GLSALLEWTQSWLPSRVTSPSDLASNALGAWAGALAHARVGPWLDRRLQKQLSLHLPLANIVYLLLPLTALNALALQHPYELAAQLPLAVFTAFIAAGLYKHRLEGGARPFAGAYALAIGALSGIGCGALCTSSPQLWAANVLGTAGLTRLIIAVGTRLPKSERRFVALTIERALPGFVAYLFVLGLAGAGARWSALASADDAALAGGQVGAMALLRDVASFSLLGYLSSERHARSAYATRIIVGRAALIGALIALCFVSLRLGSG